MKKSSSRSPRLVGVIHLPPLPGAPGNTGRSDQTVTRIARRACEEARVLEREGFEALVIENFGDTPFFKDRVPPVTVAAMSVVAHEVRQAVRVPLGINILRNDGHSALAVAAASGCQFIRVNVLSGVAATDQGLVEGQAAELVRGRAALGTGVQIWADALVKHARSLSVDDPQLAVEELALRARADAVILTGATTGRAVDLERLRAVTSHRPPAPIYLGSGVTPENLEHYAPLMGEGQLRGVIIGSTLRRGGVAGAPLELARVRAFVRAWSRA